MNDTMTFWLGLAIDLVLLSTLASGIGLLLWTVLRKQSTRVRNSVLLTGLTLVAVTPLFWVLGRNLDLPRLVPTKVAENTIAHRQSASATGADKSASAPSVAKRQDSPAGQPTVAVPPSTAQPSSTAWTWLPPTLLLLWLGGALLTIRRTLRGHLSAFLLGRRARRTTDPRLQRLIAESANTAGLRKAPQACVSTVVPTPITLGLFVPRIVLPAAIVEELEDDRLRAVVLHEMGHIRNGDRWLRLLQQLLVTVHWWNPLVRALVRRLNGVREELCDELAVTAVSPPEFADVLVGLAETASHRRHGFTACAVLGAGELEQRVRRLLSHPQKLHGRRTMHMFSRSWIALAAVVQSALLTLVAGSLSAQGTATLEVTVKWSNGDPAVGQRIETMELAAPNSSLSQRVAMTDENGVATITGLLPGMVMVRSAWRQTMLQTMPADETFQHEVNLRGCTVDGVVTAGGTPIPGARVSLRSSSANQEGGEVAISDASGAFTLRDVPENYRIRVRAPGWAPTKPQIVRATADRIAMTFEPTAAGGSVNGTVVDAAGLPIAGAQVFIGLQRLAARPQSYGEILVADANGAFASDSVPMGAVEIKARATGHGPAKVEVTVDGAETVTIALQTQVRVRGQVIDTDGQPVSKANIFAGESWSFGGAHTMTKTDGTFELTGVPAGEIKLRANNNSQLRASTTITATPGEIATWNPRVVLGDPLSGRVLDAAGNPLERWYVYAFCAGDSIWYRGGHTDAQGRFSFGQRPDSGTFMLSTRPVGAAAPSLVLRDFDAAQSQDLIIPDSALPSATIRARIVDAAGQPVAGAALYVSFTGVLSPGMHKADSTTGRVEITPLPPREYQLQVMVGGRIVKSIGTRAVAANQVLDLGDLAID